MRISETWKSMTNFEKILWIASMSAVILSSLLSGDFNFLTTCASVLGVTALILNAKGNVAGQFLIIIFALIYGYISLQQRYYGEMITYIGMSAPIAALSIYTWLKHPYNEQEVAVAHISKLKWFILAISTIIVTIAFYYILKYFNTNNLIWSTISVATTFIAAALLMLRSEYYAIGYSANDIVLIVLWVSSTITDLQYLPMAVCFSVFLINDMYGFFSWKRMKKRQLSE